MILDSKCGKRGVLVDGVVQLGWYYHVLNHLREMKPDLEIVEDQDPGLFELARSTKDPDEVKTVRTVASVCERAYARIREIIQGARLEGKKLRDGEGPVTIGRLRREVRRVFFEAGLVEPHGNIIAMGRDAGVPHNEGNDKDVLEEGRPIVVDLYPAQENGGYYFDVTRTYCVGRAPQELKELRMWQRRPSDEALLFAGPRGRVARAPHDPAGRAGRGRVRARTGARNRPRGPRAPALERRIESRPDPSRIALHRRAGTLLSFPWTGCADRGRHLRSSRWELREPHACPLRAGDRARLGSARSWPAARRGRATP